MASAIDATKPVAGNPTTQSVRDNFATAASEITALQTAPNQTITLSGDMSGTGTAAIATTLATVNANVGTFQGITVNAKGLVTAAVDQAYATSAAMSTADNLRALKAGDTFTGKVTTVASAAGGAGVTLPHGVAPTAPVNGDLWTTTTGVFARVNAATVGPLIAANQTITLSGDATGSGTTAIPVTLATVPVAKGGTGDTGTAWTTYTPTVTAGSGTFTSVAATGRYKLLGKTCFIQINVGITTNGTAAGGVVASLPAGITCVATAVLAGREQLVTGVGVIGNVSNAATQVYIVKYDNSYPGANGAALVVSGVFETT